jgi:hypothetical protein
VASLANADQEIADMFIMKNVQKNIIKEIKKCMTTYEKNDFIGLFDENSRETVA